jgi:NAD(P) transhydrogenase subunit alpha
MTKLFGFAAVVMASINIFGGFVVTRRMLEMFNKKK